MENEMMQSTNLTELAELLINKGVELESYRAKAEDVPRVVMIHDVPHLFDGKDLDPVPVPEPVREYTPEPFIPYTLDGLVKWIKADTDHFFAKENPAALVAVESPTKVSVYTEVRGFYKLRVKLAECRYAAPEIPLNRYIDSESLFVNIQTCYIQDEYRDAVLKVVNNIKEEQSEQVADDGISQRLTMKAGVAEVSTSIFKNPAYLRPMRTFTEIEQPMSSFVLRIKEGKQAALFEADGGKWKNIAVKSIAAYLEKQLAGCNLVVIG